MYRLKNYIAIFLLLLFVRVLVPEAAMLALHSHEHTEDDQPKADNGFKLDKKHSHCHTDNFFNTPYSPTITANITAPIIIFTDSYLANHSYIWKFTFPNNTELRGPPVV
ncbi:MAG: hypothetical protein M3142_12385 [Bacteroidota bacterium]|nr:hypothetical protein [Bacteroidota bacterium]